MGRLAIAVLIVAVLGGAVVGDVHAQKNDCGYVDGPSCSGPRPIRPR